MRAVTEDVISDYLVGRFDEAIRAARAGARGQNAGNRRRLEALASRIQRFSGLWTRVNRAGFSASVRNEMEQAAALDARIARNPHYRNQLRPRIAASYLSAARRERNITQRCISVRQALMADPGNRSATSLSRACEAEARRLITNAAGRSPRDAMRVYQQVLTIVPNSSPSARTARSRLESLRRRVGADEDE